MDKIIPAIGDIKLKKLTGRDLQKFYNDMRDHGRVRAVQKTKNPGLSDSVVHGMHNLMHNALHQALREHLILWNPAEDCIAPKIHKQEMKTLTAEQVGQYLRAAEEMDLLPMFFLELSTGLRKGELAALQWDDLDVENRLEDLKQMNRLPELSVPSMPPACPTEREWQALLDAAEKISSWEPETLLSALEQISDRVLAARKAMDTLPTKEQVSNLIRLLRDLRTTLQPDGSQSARSSSPRTSAAERWEFTKKLLLVILIVLVLLVALSGLLWGLFTVWKAFRTSGA